MIKCFGHQHIWSHIKRYQNETTMKASHLLITLGQKTGNNVIVHNTHSHFLSLPSRCTSYSDLNKDKKLHGLMLGNSMLSFLGTSLTTPELTSLLYWPFYIVCESFNCIEGFDTFCTRHKITEVSHPFNNVLN